MTQTEEAEHTYYLYEKSTGKVLGTYVHHDADGGTIEVTAKTVRAMFPGHKAKDVDVAHGLRPVNSRRANPRIDPKSGEVQAKLRLILAAEKTELEGNGEDSTAITVRAVGDRDITVDDFNGRVQVLTSRGRLSVPGGRIALEQGEATLTLTTVPETVARVTVSAVDPSGQCERGSIDLEYL